MKKFCPKCGEETDRLFENLCKDCFLEGLSVRELIPKSVTVHVCSECQRYVVGKELTFSFDEALRKELKSLLKKGSVEKVDYVALGNKLELKVFISKHGLRKVEKFIVPFYEKRVLCRFCNMRRTGYHNAILQITAPKELHDRIETLVEEGVWSMVRKDNLAFISGKTRSKHGLEFKIGSKSAAMKVARMLKRKYGSEMKLSRKLIGRKDGKNLYRLTIFLKVNYHLLK